MNVITSPLLLRYDSPKPNFLKTDWSTSGMGYILMQLDNSLESITAIKHLDSTDGRLFDLTLFNPCLKPVLFNSLSNIFHENNYHSFVGDGACSRWVISRLCKYLWGIFFYWLCDCNAIKDILQCNGSVYQLKQWTKEHIGYKFVIIHCVATIMKNTDAISHYVDSFVYQYNITAARLYIEDVTERPFAYSFDVFIRYTSPHCVKVTDAISISITTSSITLISAFYHSPINFSPVFSISLIPSFFLMPIIVSYSVPLYLLRTSVGYLLI